MALPEKYEVPKKADLRGDKKVGEWLRKIREPQDASLAALAIGVPSPRNSDFDGVRRDYLFLKCGASKAEVVEGAMFRFPCRWTSEIAAA